MKTSIKTGLRILRASLTAAALIVGCGDDGPEPALDDEIAQEIAAEERASQAAIDFELLVADGNPDPIGALVAILQADPNLTDVVRLDSLGTVVATTTDGVPFGVMVAEMDRPEWAEVSDAEIPGPLSGSTGTADRSWDELVASSPIVCNPSNFPQSKKACILRSTLTAAGAVQDQGIDQSLQKAGFEVTTLPFPSKVSEVIQLHQMLSTCGVLYIRSHGGVAKSLAGEYGNHLVTEVTSATLEERQQLKAALGPNAKQYFGKQASARSGKTFLTLSPQFFASVQYPNTLVFINGCGSGSSLQGLVGGDVLRDAFRNHGAGAFVGWNTVVSARLAGSAATQFFDALAPKVIVDQVDVTVTPPSPGPGQSYVPSATITPAQVNVEVSLSVRGTDGFIRDETLSTNASGMVTFTSIPGAVGGTTDSVTVVAGGANDSQTADSVVKNNPELQTTDKLPFLLTLAGVKSMAFDAGSPSFNLVCNNSKISKTVAVVKF